ncbi:hypothetical protein INT47_010891 [Mucor saturninus]|uniref:Uncharacterized protein n=1 Tax=Mucor saturninus TaxID=64648 RepID=A0A8H7V715_9FUNG|nr:hypothetical protein INT47_010891 [Mucor saturninus]
MFGSINFNAPSSSTASTSSAPIEDDRTRDPNWSVAEECLLIQVYNKNLGSLEKTKRDCEKGEKYTEMSIEHNELARRQNLRNFKEEFARRQSTGESGFEPDVVYDKLEEILTKLPTILPPVTYSSHSRQFVDSTNGVNQGSSTAPTETSSAPIGEHERPAPPQESQPPSSAPPRCPRSNEGSTPATTTSDTEAMLNRIVDRGHELRNGTFRESREYMDSRLGRRDPTGEAIIASLNRATAALERNGDRLNELHNRMNEQRPNQ